jgi:hypothetical protein
MFPSANPLIVFLCAFLLLLGCKSSQLPEVSQEGKNLVSSEVKNLSEQASIEQEVQRVIPEELQPLQGQRLDSARIVNEVSQQVGDKLSETVDLPPVKKVSLDSTLLNEAVRHGAREAERYAQEKYGIAIESVQLDSSTYSEIQSHAKREAEKYILEHSGQNILLDSLSSQSLLNQSEELIAKQLEESDYFQELKNTIDSNEGFLYAQKDRLQSEKARLDGLIDQAALREKMTNAAKDFIQTNAKEIQSAQNQMNTIKQQYNKVSNSNDLSTAVKRTSLEEESLGKRLIFGGNFNVGRVEPFSIDISPLLGYRFNKLFSAGIAGTYRTQFERDDIQVKQGESTVYGYSLFVSHQVYRNFFGYVEGENKATSVKLEDGKSVNWTKGLLVGIGRNIKIGKEVNMQVLVLYNFLYQNSDQLYNSPLVIKTGIQF